MRRRGKEIEEYRLELFKREYLPRVKPLPDGLGNSSSGSRRTARGSRWRLRPRSRSWSATSRSPGSRTSSMRRPRRTTRRRSKPHPDIFEAALGRLQGIEASGAIAVGDTPYDAQAAGKIGLRTDRPALRRLARSGAPRGRVHRDLPRPGRPPASLRSIPAGGVIAVSGRSGFGVGSLARSFPPPDLDLAEPGHRLVMAADRRRELPDRGGEPKARVELLLRRCPDDERSPRPHLRGRRGTRPRRRAGRPARRSTRRGRPAGGPPGPSTPGSRGARWRCASGAMSRPSGRSTGRGNRATGTTRLRGRTPARCNPAAAPPA